MPLIKNVQARELTQKAVVFDLGDVRRQADAELREARAEADRIIAEATEEARRLVEGATARGHAEGLAAGQGQGHAEGLIEGRSEGEGAARTAMAEQLAMLESGWREALKAWNVQRASQLEDGRRDLLRFALDITRRIVGELPGRNHELVLGQVAQAMELLADRTRLRIRVNGEDMALLERHIPAILAEAGVEGDARIEPDESVPRGSCLLVTPDGQVDGRFDTQLDRIVEGLLPELKDEEHSS